MENEIYCDLPLYICTNYQGYACRWPTPRPALLFVRQFRVRLVLYNNFRTLKLYIFIFPASCTEYYVSANGTFNVQCSFAEPCSPIAAAARTIDGDTIFFLPGIYITNEQLMIQTASVTLKPAQNVSQAERVYISAKSAGFLLRARNISVQGIVFSKCAGTTLVVETNASAVISDCIFEDNSLVQDTGVISVHGNVTLERCRFLRNRLSLSVAYERVSGTAVTILPRCDQSDLTFNIIDCEFMGTLSFPRCSRSPSLTPELFLRQIMLLLPNLLYQRLEEVHWPILKHPASPEKCQHEHCSSPTRLFAPTSLNFVRLVLFD